MHVAIVGGGVGGLCAATALAERGYRVTLFERRAQLGGRAYSLADETTGDTIDNGQHLFMGCYRAFLKFLRRIGSEHLLKLQEQLEVTFVDGEKRSRLRARKLPAPFHLLGGLLGFGALPWSDKLRLVRLGVELGRAHDYDTVEKWLDRLGQSAAARRAFWRPLALATLNDDPRTASAKMLEAVLREGFFGARDDSRLGLASVGLSALYVDGARKFLEARGGEIKTSAAVERLLVDGRAARGVVVAGARVEADAVIAAVPPPALAELVPDRGDEPYFANLSRLQASPIVSVHLWLDRLVTDEAMLGLIDRPVHWIFHRNQLAAVRDPNRSHLSTVTSAARERVEQPAQAWIDLALDEARRALPRAASAKLLHARVLKERAATIAHTAGTESLRPGVRSPIENFFVVGDFVRTGLPATVESAARSAEEAAAQVAAVADEARMRAALRATRDTTFVPVGRLRRA